MLSFDQIREIRDDISTWRAEVIRNVIIAVIFGVLALTSIWVIHGFQAQSTSEGMKQLLNATESIVFWFNLFVWIVVTCFLISALVKVIKINKSKATLRADEMNR